MNELCEKVICRLRKKGAKYSWVEIGLHHEVDKDDSIAALLDSIADSVSLWEIFVQLPLSVSE